MAQKNKIKLYARLVVILLIFLFIIFFSGKSFAADDDGCKAKGEGFECIDTTQVVNEPVCQPAETCADISCSNRTLCKGQFADIKYNCCKGAEFAGTVTCNLKYPDGACTSGNQACPEGKTEDDQEGLCSSGKCCHGQAQGYNYQLQIPILDTTNITSLDQYIKSVYVSALYILIPLAIIVIIFAGVMWIMAAGNVARIKRAKEYIVGAFTGILIALLSYPILSFVGIDRISTPNVRYIETVDITPLEFSENYFVGIPGMAGTAATGAYVPGLNTETGVPIYRQGCDRTVKPNVCPPWANKPYGCPTGTRYAASACGATSFAMVISYYGVRMDPYQAGQNVLYPNHCRGCSGGTSRDCFEGKPPGALNQIGFKGVAVPHDKVVAYLQAKKPLIGSVGANTKFTGARHFIVLAGYKDGYIIVHDPNGKHPSPWPSKPEEVLKSSTYFYYIAPAGQFSPL